MENIDLLLIYPPYHRRKGSGSIFPLGLGYIASSSQQYGFNVKIINCTIEFNSLTQKSLMSFRNWLRHQLLNCKPNLMIGIGPVTTPVVKALEVISNLCSEIYPQIPVVYGGPLASISNQEWYFFDILKADAIVPGDGEFIIPQILKSLSRDHTFPITDGIKFSQNDVAKTNVIHDLDCIPFPLRETEYLDNSPSIRRDLFLRPMATMVASRGCPYRCSFCVSGIIRDSLFTRRSYKNIVREMEFLYNNYGTRQIIFYDDCFFPNPNRINEDVELFYKEIGELKDKMFWQIEIRADAAFSLVPESIKLLQKSGCKQVNIGIEKSSDQALNMLGKNIKRDTIISACTNISENAPGINLTGTFVLGGPNENEKTIYETIEFSKELRLLYAHFYPLELYPGTHLYNNLHKGDSKWWYEMIMEDPLPWGEVIYEDTTIDKDTLLNMIDISYEEFYGRSEWHKLASKKLKENYEQVVKEINFLKVDRFNLNGE